jgi:hypothetical protein
MSDLKIKVYWGNKNTGTFKIKNKKKLKEFVNELGVKLG